MLYSIDISGDISSDPRKLFKIANKILSPPDEKILPILPNTSNFQLCSLFEKFFENKIASINNIICASIPSILNPTISIIHNIYSLSTFTIPSLYEVNDLLMKSHCTSPTDPLRISLYQQLPPSFSPIYLDISQSQDFHNIPYSKKTKPRPKLI